MSVLTCRITIVIDFNSFTLIVCSSRCLKRIPMFSLSDPFRLDMQPSESSSNNNGNTAGNSIQLSNISTRNSDKGKVSNHDALVNKIKKTVITEDKSNATESTIVIDQSEDKNKQCVTSSLNWHNTNYSKRRKHSPLSCIRKPAESEFEDAEV